MSIIHQSNGKLVLNRRRFDFLLHNEKIWTKPKRRTKKNSGNFSALFLFLLDYLIWVQFSSDLSTFLFYIKNLHTNFLILSHTRTQHKYNRKCYNTTTKSDEMNTHSQRHTAHRKTKWRNKNLFTSNFE